MKKIKLIFFYFLVNQNAFCQFNFDRTFSLNDQTSGLNIDSPNKIDYSVCKSNNPDANHVAVSSFIEDCEGFNVYQIKALEFNTTGTITKSKSICAVAALNLVPLDIKPLNNSQGYVICGYMEPMTGNYPMHPIAIVIDNDFNQIYSKSLPEIGMFSRVCERADGSFVFIGNTGDTTDALSHKQGLITISTFNLSNFNSFISPTSYNNQSFTNFNDIKYIENNDVLIAGSIMIDSAINCTEIRVCLFRFNTQSGNIIWQNCRIGNVFTSPKIDFNDQNIFLVANAENPSAPILAKFDLNGNYLNSILIEANSTYDCQNQKLLTHIPYIQNIKILDHSNVMLTGKFILGTQFPFDLKVLVNDPNSSNWSFYDENLYFTEYTAPNTDLLNYKSITSNTPCINNLLITPIYTTNNSTWIENKAYTVTYTDVIGNPPQNRFKTWTFNNCNTSVYGFGTINFYSNQYLIRSQKNISVHSSINLSNILYLNIEDIISQEIICPMRGSCCN